MQELLETIKRLAFSSISGVPDSILSQLISSLEESELGRFIHVTPNEGSAIALATGTFLGSGRPGLVYFQNSGLGNGINPLASLAHKNLFGIPMVLIIGWRGALGDDGIQIQDEPQHLIQGSITINQLKDLQIPYVISQLNQTSFAKHLEEMYFKSIEIMGPVSILVKPGLFDEKLKKKYEGFATIESQEAIETVLSLCDEESIIIGSTGMISRELLKVTENNTKFAHSMFLNIGAMGHATMISKGIALSLPNRKILCFDGDGALAMHLGSMSVLTKLANFTHILLNNASHDSVGGQRTSLGKSDLSPILNYFSGNKYIKISDINFSTKKELTDLLNSDTNKIIEFICKPRSTHKLPRPKLLPFENKQKFMQELMQKARAK